MSPLGYKFDGANTLSAHLAVELFAAVSYGRFRFY